MTQALRYILFGAVIASIVALFKPVWWVVLIAFWIGTVVGLLVTLMDYSLTRLYKRFAND